MKRRINTFNAMIGILVTVLLFPSCGGDRILDQHPVSVMHNPDFTKLTVSDPGRMHNEILAEYIKEEELIFKETTDSKPAAGIFIQSANRILEQRGIPARIEVQDFDYIIQHVPFIEHEKASNEYGGGDEIRGKTDPQIIISNLQTDVDLSRSDIDRLRKAMMELRKIDVNVSNANKFSEVAGRFRSVANPSDNPVDMALAIAVKSFEFWAARTNSPVIEHIEDVEQSRNNLGKYDPTVDTILWDCVGGLLFFETGPGALIAAAGFSIAYYKTATWLEGRDKK